MTNIRKKRSVRFKLGIPGIAESEWIEEWESEENAETVLSKNIPIDQLGEFISRLRNDKDFHGYYHILAKHSGKALDVQDANKDDGANVF